MTGTTPPNSAKVIQGNVNNMEEIEPSLYQLSISPPQTPVKKSPKRKANEMDDKVNTIDADRLKASVKSKFDDGDCKAALQLVASCDKLKTPDEHTIAALKAKHPEAHDSIPDKQNTNVQPLAVEEKTVFAAVNSFRPGSSSGYDGLRPIAVQQLLSDSAN